MKPVRQLPESEHLGSLPFLDAGALGRIIGDHLSNRADHAVMLALLLTIDTFLKPEDAMARQGCGVATAH